MKKSFETVLGGIGRHGAAAGVNDLCYAAWLFGYGAVLRMPARPGAVLAGAIVCAGVFPRPGTPACVVVCYGCVGMDACGPPPECRRSHHVASRAERGMHGVRARRVAVKGRSCCGGCSGAMRAHGSRSGVVRRR